MKKKKIANINVLKITLKKKVDIWKSIEQWFGLFSSLSLSFPRSFDPE